jgi:membrane-associated HD superfamily phosphohydrolase
MRGSKEECNEKGIAQQEGTTQERRTRVREKRRTYERTEEMKERRKRRVKNLREEGIKQRRKNEEKENGQRNERKKEMKTDKFSKRACCSPLSCRTVLDHRKYQRSRVADILKSAMVRHSKAKQSHAAPRALGAQTRRRCLKSTAYHHGRHCSKPF